MASSKRKKDPFDPRHMRQTLGGNRISRKQGRKGTAGKPYCYRQAKVEMAKKIAEEKK